MNIPNWNNKVFVIYRSFYVDFNSQREIMFGHLTINPIYMFLVMYMNFLKNKKKCIHIRRIKLLQPMLG